MLVNARTLNLFAPFGKRAGWPCKLRPAMRTIRWMSLGLLVLVLAPIASWAPIFGGLAPERIDRESGFPGRPEIPQVLLVSIDGLAPRFMGERETPTLARLGREGLRARLARTVVPSLTMTSHTSMISGVPPEIHGVLWNHYQPWRQIEVPTLFDACAAERLRCGLMAGKRKFAHFAEEEPGVDRYVFAPDAAAVFEAALVYLRERRPDFVMIHLAEVDLTGHDHGWGSDEQRSAIERIDGLLGLFVAAAAAEERPLRLLVTADHGGSDTGHGSASKDDAEIPWILWGHGIPRGVIADEVSTLDTAATVATLLGVEPLGEGVSRFP